MPAKPPPFTKSMSLFSFFSSFCGAFSVPPSPVEVGMLILPSSPIFFIDFSNPSAALLEVLSIPPPMSFAAAPTMGIPPSKPISVFPTAPPRNLTPPLTAPPIAPLTTGKRAGHMNFNAKAPAPNVASPFKRPPRKLPPSPFLLPKSSPLTPCGPCGPAGPFKPKSLSSKSFFCCASCSSKSLSSFKSFSNLFSTII